ncbi:MAG TPA: AraC family transcriptional regulator [Methylibium sp.]|nr:AraC family transcriptional regulator [Methylibium sp.]
MSELISLTDLPTWVPGRVLGAADSLGWNGIGLRAYGYTGLDVEVPPMREFMIVSYLRGATPMQRCFEGGAWTRTRCEPGDVSLLTRSHRSHWHWTESVDVCHVYLTDRLVSSVANEIMDRNVTEVRLLDVLKTRDPIVTALTAAIAQEAGQHALGGALYVEALGTQLAVHLLRNYAELRFREPAGRGRLSPSMTRRVADHIDQNLQEPLTLESLAGIAGLGVWSFGRHFRASFGCAPHAYVIERRLVRAEALLMQGRLPVKEIASACGFADQAHMTRVFRARRGTTPAALRRGAGH